MDPFSFYVYCGLLRSDVGTELCTNNTVQQNEQIFSPLKNNK
jgi:hypothetical protein